MSSCLMRYSVIYEHNTLDACWIAVDVWSNSSRCRIIALDMRFSNNCSTVIFSLTVLFAILGEASSETYGPRVYFPSYKFLIYYSCNLLLSDL